MLANGVQETASAPGTATTINLAGPPTGRRGFLSAFATGAAVYYTMDDGTQFECGVGTVTAGSPNTLTRGTVLSNSAGTTARLNFTGTTRIICAMLAERMSWMQVQAPVAVSAAANQVLLLPSAFRRFRLTCQDIRADATGRNLALQFSTDGGSTWIASTSNTYFGLYAAGATSFPFDQGSAACMYLSIMLSFSGNGQTDATAEIFPGNASRAATMKAVVNGNNNTNWYSGTFGGACATSGVANAIRVLTTTGTSSAVAAGSFSGTLILEGLLN